MGLFRRFYSVPHQLSSPYAYWAALEKPSFVKLKLLSILRQTYKCALPLVLAQSMAGLHVFNLQSIGPRYDDPSGISNNEQKDDLQWRGTIFVRAHRGLAGCQSAGRGLSLIFAFLGISGGG